MPVYRYVQISIDVNTLARSVAAPVTLGETGPDILVDVSTSSSAKADLDVAMAELGWAFYSQDPDTTPREQANVNSALGYVQVDVSSGGAIVLDPPQCAAKFVVLVGILTSDVALRFPLGANGQEWVLVNRCVLSTYSISMSVNGSGNIITMPNGTMHVWTDGIDLLPVSALVV